MNDSCVRITLDVQNVSTSVFVPVKRSDTGRKILINLVDGGFPYEIAEDCYAVLSGTKPDGNILFNHCSIDGNTIIYEVTEQTTAAAGRILCAVQLYGADDALITSAIFRIIVDGTIYVNNQVESSSEFSALTKLISEANTLIDDVEAKLENGEFVGPQGPQGKGTTISTKRFEKGDLSGATNSGKSGLKVIKVTTDPATGSFSQSENYVFDGDGIDSVSVEMLEPDSDPTAAIQNPFPTLRELHLGIPRSKSAYEYAKDGGYEGTEEEFAELMGNPDSSESASIYIGPEQPTDGTLYWLDTSEDEEIVEPEVTLTGISAAYSGGEVAVGTDVSALTGIVVTAEYSDGSTATVTNYTLSGEIVEGSNTITVEYEGMTATFAVTGVAESSGEEEPEVVTYTVTNTLTNVTSSNGAESVEENSAYTATLTAEDGYELDIVTVTMGGADVTYAVYAGGVVSISAVTGDVVIIASATAAGVEGGIYKLADISVETTVGQNASGTAAVAPYTRYKIENIKTGDTVRLAGVNGDGTIGWYDGTTSHALNDTSWFTNAYQDNYAWKQYTWIADKDYDYLYFASSHTMLESHPNSAATIEKAVN